MPDFGAPVAQNVQAPNSNQIINTLSGLMGISQQRQALQVGQGNVQNAQEQMRERLLLQNVMASGKTPDGTSLRGQDGEIDPVAMSKFANTNLPLLGQGIQQSIIQTQNNRIQLNNAVRGLNQNYRNDVSGIVRSAIGTQQTPEQIGAALDSYAQKNPQATAAITRAQSLIQGLNPNMPQSQRDQALTHLAMEFQPAQQTAGMQNVQNETYTGPGGTVQHYQTNQYAPGGVGQYGPSAQMGYLPNAGVTQDQAGNLIYYNTENPGSVNLVGHGGPAPSNVPVASNQQAGRYGTPAAILNGLLQAENGGPNGDPYAINAKSGAMGPYQFTPGTLSALAKQGVHFDPFNPQQARDAADLYMSQLIKQNGGNYDKAIAQYGGFVTQNPDRYIAQVESGGQPQGGYQPPVLQMGQKDIIQQNTQTINQTRVAAANAQTEMNVLQHIDSLAHAPNIYLGPGSPEVGKLATAVAAIPGMEGAAKYADNYNELAKYMAQNAVRMGKQLGLSGSDARIDLAVQANPNGTIGPQAIIGIAQYQMALVRMSVAKADAMDKWLSQPGNSLQNEQEFERTWRDNADPRLFQMTGMQNQADAQEYAKSHISKVEMKDLQQKWQVLHGLGAF